MESDTWLSIFVSFLCVDHNTKHRHYFADPSIASIVRSEKNQKTKRTLGRY